MNLFRNRPLALVCVIFVGVSLLFARTKLWVSIVLGAIGLLTTFVLTLIHMKKRRHSFVVVICICVSVFLSALASFFAFDLPAYRLINYDDQTVEVEATVNDILYEGEFYTEYKVKLTSVNGEHTNVFVNLTTEDIFTEGDRFCATATITAYEKDNFTLHSYDYADKIYGSIAVEDDLVPLSPSRNPLYLAKKLNHAVSSFLETHFEGDAASLMSAMLIGDRSNLSPMTSYEFRRAGVSHLLAMSGLHVSILCFAITKLCGLLRIHRRPASVIVLIFVFLYAVLVGLTPSIVRASIMTGIVMLGVLLMREHDSITSLFFAAALIALFSPNALLDVGYWMSVFATLGILLVETVEDYLKRRKIAKTHPEDVEEDPKRPHPFVRFVYYNLALPLLFTLSATLLTLPFSCFIFGQVSVLFLVTNLIFPTLMSLFLYVAILSIPLWFLRPITNLFAVGYLKLMGVFAKIPETLVPLTAPYVKVALIALVGVVALFVVMNMKRKKPWLISIAALSLIFCGTIGISYLVYHRDTSIHYVSSFNSNDYIILHEKDKTVLCGATSSTSYSFTAPINEILNLGENEIDILYLPHYHTDMANALYQLTGNILIREIYVLPPSSAYEMQAYETLSFACEKYSIALTQVDGSHQITCGGITITALPRLVSVNGKEHGNAALRAELCGESLLYFSAGYTTSDAFTPYIYPFEESAEILIFGCHGTNVQRDTPPNYPLTSQTHTILLSCEDTGISLSKEEYEIYVSIAVEKGLDIWSKKYK